MSAARRKRVNTDDVASPEMYKWDVERDAVGSGAGLRPGMRVEVATRFEGDWATGFEVASVADHGCRIRRISDGSVLPVDFAYPRVRPAVA